MSNENKPTESVIFGVCPVCHANVKYPNQEITQISTAEADMPALWWHTNCLKLYRGNVKK